MLPRSNTSIYTYKIQQFNAPNTFFLSKDFQILFIQVIFC